MSPILGQVNGAGLRARFLAGASALTALLPLPAFAADPGAVESGRLVVLSALACGAVGLAIAASLWALAEQRTAQRLRRSQRAAGARIKAAVGERDALLGAGREALVVWGRDGSGPLSYGGGDELLQSCLKGADALSLSKALDDLADRGLAFQIPVADAHGRKLMARGRA